jgi:hypothetical protein
MEISILVLPVFIVWKTVLLLHDIIFMWNMCKYCVAWLMVEKPVESSVALYVYRKHSLICNV